MNLILIYMTASSAEEAEKISKALLDERLIACANIMPAHKALYWWEGKIESAVEVAVIMKTKASLFETTKARVLELHGYDCPCLVSIKIEQAHQDFLDWIADQVQ